jgi:16S rRNA (cytosine967-C5)-methyltransferase
MAVGRGSRHSDDLLRGNAVSSLSAPDRHLAMALVLGVLRGKIELDLRLQAFLTRPNAKLDAEVLIALRLGAFQLRHMDRIPARAAIDESVELTKQAGHKFASGMVNAVLRKMAAGAAAAKKMQPLVEGCSATESAAVEAHPAWMVERWGEFFGKQATCVLCGHNQSQPALTIRVSGPVVEAELTATGITLASGELLTAARVVTGGDVTATDAFRDGRARMQDEGSQLVAEIAGKGSTILDCCAAPGGKTLILAERNPDARIVASESSVDRLEQLRNRLAPISDRVECRLADATVLTDANAYDVVLADVPCSGTGTLGRNPEIRHRLRVEDLARQAERQGAILASALRCVRPGGRVVYSTCSLETEENEQVVAAVMREEINARVVPLAGRIDEMRAAGIVTESGADDLRDCVTSEGYLRLLPGSFHTDGFFVALIEKVV